MSLVVLFYRALAPTGSTEKCKPDLQVSTKPALVAQDRVALNHSLMSKTTETVNVPRKRAIIIADFSRQLGKPHDLSPR